MQTTASPAVVRLDEYRWEIPTTRRPGMLVPGRVYATDRLMEQIQRDQALDQVANVACLPGIVGRSLGMPDLHWGYGFAVGGVAATRADGGVVSPGGIGFDINCGVRLLRTDLVESEVRPRLDRLADAIFRAVPSGLGTHGRIRLGRAEIDRVLRDGARWAVSSGYGWPEDLEVTEEGGRLAGADPSVVSDRARQRGAPQLGTLGSGNHFLEVQAVEAVLDAKAAEAFGLFGPGQVCVFIHTGSRGLGHQVCEDYLKVMAQVAARVGIALPDRQLACAPLDTPEAQDYLGAMAAAANFAWANRQAIAHWTREAFAEVFGQSPADLGMRLVYDVAHNMAKLEEHEVEGERVRLCVHRKGATRAFPAGHPDVPPVYRDVGQPVLIPGDMGRSSYVAVGTPQAMVETFGSSCHGAGRVQSRAAAKRSLKGVDLVARLRARGIIVRVANPALLGEEASEAYKDVSEVIRAVEGAGIARAVARLKPLAVVKG